jgi:hypothetical protein
MLAFSRLHRRCSSMAEHQLPKLNTRVRFPSSAPYLSSANAVRMFDYTASMSQDVTTRSKVSPAAFSASSWPVRIEAHRQTRVLMSYPCGDHSGRDTLQMHQGRAGTPGGVQLDVSKPCGFYRLSPVPRQDAGRIRFADLVADYVGPGAAVRPECQLLRSLACLGRNRPTAPCRPQSCCRHGANTSRREQPWLRRGF